jgi:SMI1 / KNR4 family (SUKH-1)
MARFSGGFAPVTEQRIAACENGLGVRLPADYKHFLRTVNGGVPTPNCFSVPDRGDALVDFLYGIGQERTAADLEFEQEQATLFDPLPPGVLAIGHDPGGNTLLLATLGGDGGRVFYWDRTGLWVREDRQNTFPIAGSFTELLVSLRALDEAEPDGAPDRGGRK